MSAQPLETAIVLYTATAPRSSRTLAGLNKAIAPWLTDRQQLDLAVNVLLDRDWIRREGRARFATTPEGATAAARALDLIQLPTRLRWGAARNLLLAQALGAPGDPAKVGRTDVLVATVVAHDQGIDLPAGAALGRVRDALVWKQLGADGTRPLTLEGVRRHVLSQLVRSERVQESDAIVRQLAARALGARSLSASELQRAAFGRWVASGEPDLASFAAAVLSTARRCKTGRFGEDKVFISHIAPAFGGETTEFKKRLVEANRQRLLTLVRADLVSVMDPVDVAGSETRDGVAEYHFVVIPAARGPS